MAQGGHVPAGLAAGGENAGTLGDFIFFSIDLDGD
jgi:hypothetical protein